MGSTLATAAYRERKRAKGICYYGGCWEPATRGGRCEEHAEADAAQNREDRRVAKRQRAHRARRRNREGGG